MTFPRFILLYIICLILSAAFARQVLGYLTRHLGNTAVSHLSWGTLGGTFILILFCIRKRGRPWKTVFPFLLSFLGISLVLVAIHNPDERIHIFQYGGLGFLLMYAKRNIPRGKAFLGSFLILLLVACADELFQAFLPTRVGDLRDVGIGCIGGAWGEILAILMGIKSPSPQ